MSKLILSPIYNIKVQLTIANPCHSLLREDFFIVVAKLVPNLFFKQNQENSHIIRLIYL